MVKIAEPSRRRLVQIARILSKIKAERITSVKLEELTGWSGALIRKDISIMGYRGGVSNGYEVKALREAICSALEIVLDASESEYRACIAGLGKLGASLLENSIFFNTPFRIVAGFDSNVNRTEILRASFPLHPAARMDSVIQNEKIVLAILTVKDEEAQSMTDRLVKCGIRGIVNYTGEVLIVPPEVMVENVSPVLALNNLTARISGKSGGLV